MAVKHAKVSCAGCGQAFSWRSLERLAARIREHNCWHPPAERPFKPYTDQRGQRDG